MNITLEIYETTTPTDLIINDTNPNISIEIFEQATVYLNGSPTPSFIQLTDTPTSYIGQSGKFPKVNNTESGIEFVPLAGGGDMLASNNLSDVVDPSVARTNLGIEIGTNIQAFSIVLQNATESFITALKTAYDSSVAWISTNGASLLAHIGLTNNPHNVTKTQVGLGNVPDVDLSGDVAINNTKISFDNISSTRLAGTSGVNTGDQDISGIATNTTNLSTHEANTSNPHSVTKTQVGLSNADNTSDLNKPISNAQASVNSLKADLVGGLVPTSQIPALAISEFLGDTTSEAQMLALVGQRGDWTIRTDVNRTYFITAEPSSLLANWRYIESPSSAVTSVNGQTGVIVLGANDVGAPTGSGNSTGTNTGDQDISGITTNANNISTIQGEQTTQNSAITLNTAKRSYPTGDETKLGGIQAGATANDTDANLRARANHTGTQIASTISDFQATVSTNTDVVLNKSRIIETRASATRYFWDGTQAQYDAIVTKDAGTYYFIT